jgi:YD repeat-containing protein
MNCNGCGVELDPSEAQVNASVDQILETSLQDAHRKGGVCPLCGHSKQVPYSHRKTVLFGLLLAALIIAAATAFVVYQSRQTERTAVASDAVARMTRNPDVVKFLGKPITIAPGLQGEVKQDETAWTEAHLTIPVHGPDGDAIAHVIGGHGIGPWVFTTFEVGFEKQHQKVDLVSGRVVEYDPNAYVDIHTQAAVAPEYTTTLAAEPRFDGEFPCVFASVNAGDVVPQFGKCAMPTAHVGAIDRFEVDLRNGNFVLRQSDLYVNDVFEVPLTRSYRSYDWVSVNPVHAFGRNANHPFDIAPIGTRNPYTYQMIVLEDGDFLYFDRISKGTGYADSVFQHTETSTRFYKATQRWNGKGWTTRLADGSEIRFPESYNARNLAQGAPTEMLDAQGNHLDLRRDPQRNLQEIKTPHGHGIKFTYDDLSRIKQAEDDAGHWARYEYNSDGMLKSAILSSGRERHYDYDRTHMITIADETGRILLRNWYQRECVIRQEFANGMVYRYAYDWPKGRYYPNKVVVTMPNFTNREVHVADSVPEFVQNYNHR